MIQEIKAIGQRVLEVAEFLAKGYDRLRSVFLPADGIAPDANPAHAAADLIERLRDDAVNAKNELAQVRALAGQVVEAGFSPIIDAIRAQTAVAADDTTKAAFLRSVGFIQSAVDSSWVDSVTKKAYAQISVAVLAVRDRAFAPFKAILRNPAALAPAAVRAEPAAPAPVAEGAQSTQQDPNASPA